MRRVVAFVAAGALLGGLITVTSEVAGPLPRAFADHIDCSIDSPFLVNQASVGTDVLNKDNRIERYDLSAGMGGNGGIVELVLDADTTPFPNRPSGVKEETNGLGISADGHILYFTSHYLTGHQSAAPAGSQIYEYNTVTGATRAWATAATPNTDDNLRVRRGAVDPTTGVFYYSTSSADGLIQYLYAINPNDAAPAAWYVGTISTPVNGGVSGDFAFDGAGTMYVVTGSSDTAYVNILVGDLPTAAGTPQQFTVQNISTVGSTGNGVGVSYGLDGYLYLTNTAGDWFRVDPSDGALVHEYNSIGGNGASVDIATCAFPSTLTVVKDVESKPYANDQFTISASRTGPTGATVGQPATTTGGTGAARATVGPVPVLTGGGATYTITEQLAATPAPSSTNLTAYGTHVTCVDQAPGAATTVLADVDLAGSGTARSLTGLSLAGPSGTATRQEVVCTLTNRDVRPARLVLQKEANPESAEEYSVAFPNPGGTPDGAGVWPNAPRPAGTISDPVSGTAQTISFTFPPYNCTTEATKHVFSGCSAYDIGATTTDVALPELASGGVLQFQEQLTAAQQAAGWRQSGYPTCSASNSNAAAGAVNLDTVSSTDGALWSSTTAGLSDYQVAVGSVQPGTTITCIVRNTETPPTWTIGKLSTPTSGTAADPAEVLPGQTITYHLIASNPSSATATDITVTDDLSEVLQPGVVAGTATAPPGTTAVVDLAGETLTWMIPSLAGGARLELTYTVTIGEDADVYGIELVNSVSATGTTPSGIPAGPENCTPAVPCQTFHDVPDPQWNVAKGTETGTLDPGDGAYLTTPGPGFPIHYTLTVDNTGGLVPLYGVTVSDGPTEGGDIWDHATWDGTFTVRIGPVTTYASYVDGDPSDGLQYTFTEPIPPGEVGVITLSLILDSDQYEVVRTNTVAGRIVTPSDPSEVFDPATCSPTDTSAPDCTVTHKVELSTLTLRKTTTPAGQEASFNLIADSGFATEQVPGVPTSFSGDSGTPAVSDQPALPGVVYAIVEQTDDPLEQDAWEFGSWRCWDESDPGADLVDIRYTRIAPGQANLVIRGGADIVCSVANSAEPPTLTLVKEVENSHGGTATPADWTLTATEDGETEPITNGQVVDAGEDYALAQSGDPAGYATDDPEWSCVDTSEPFTEVEYLQTASGWVVTPKVGQDIVCTSIARDLPAIVTVEKVDEDGEPLAGATFELWRDDGAPGVFDPATDTLLASGSTGPGPTPAAGTITWSGLDWGGYFLRETVAPSGYGPPGGLRYVLLDGDSTSGSGSIVTFVNYVVPPVIAISKTASIGPAVAPGASVTYTLTAVNRTASPAYSVTATDDLADVLRVADLVEPLPAELTRSGTVITWTLPDPVGAAATVQVSYEVLVRADAPASEFTNLAVLDVPGGSGLCDGCSVTLDVDPDLAQTGFDIWFLLRIAALLVLVGAAALVITRLRGRFSEV